jgi:glycosyltransferase involved in cell wall biosynthesis
MRFCLIGPVWPYRGGISHNSAILANAVIKEGHEILLISFRRQYPQWLYPGRTDQDNSINPLIAPAEYILDPLSPYTWKKAANIVLSYKPELVIIQWWTFFWSIPIAYIARYIRTHHVRLAFIIHNVASHETHPLDRLLTRLALNPAQDFLVFSELEKQKLEKLFPGKRVILSHLPVFSFECANEVSKLSARKSLNLPDKETILLFFGFVRQYKGLYVVIKALLGLKKKGISPYLAIVGEFWKDKQYYLDLIKQGGIEAQVRIEDRYVPNEEAGLWFKAADVLVAPYIEGVTQSAVASLAMGYGIPMILTTQVAQGLEEFDKSLVRVVPPEDIEALEHEIIYFMDNYHGLENISYVNASRTEQIIKPLLLLADDQK